jgi:hypothetical protein
MHAHGGVLRDGAECLARGHFLETPFDWVSLLIFAGLVVLFLQRSSEENPRDHLWQYLVPAVGCAVANYVGNEGYAVVAVAILAAVLAFIHYVLKPFQKGEG